MEWDPRKSRLMIATYVFCFIAIVLSSLLGSSYLGTVGEASNRQVTTKPNIILIMADDLGWNDVSFHGYNEILTPNLDRLAHEGVILNGFYAQYLCTPSRSALMTGKYPIRHGLQHWIVKNSQAGGVPASEKFVSQYLKELGYSTHMIGKYRIPPEYQGFDLWNNTRPAAEYTGQYATHVLNDAAVQRIEGHDFTQPLFMFLSHCGPHAASGEEILQAPQEYVDRFSNITHLGRRKYAGMVSAVDDSVGNVVRTLKRRGVLNNTIIVFLSDNGGSGEEQAILTRDETSFGSNWPLRGAKGTQFEGGVRVTAAIWSPLLHNSRRVSTELYHITDLLPTFVHVAGGTINSSASLDGINIWTSLSEDLPSPRTELLIQADATAGEYALRWNQYKIMSGLTVNAAGKAGSDWYEPSGGLNPSLITNLPGTLECGNAPKTPCDPNVAPCLFDVVLDPCERNNIAYDHPDIVETMMEKLRAYNSSALPSPRRALDERAQKQYLNGLLSPWED